MKNDRINARIFKTNPIGNYSVSGCMVKMTGYFVEFSGVVKHIRTSNSQPAEEIAFFIDIDEVKNARDYSFEFIRPFGCNCSHGHVLIKPEQIVEIIKK